MAIRVSRRKVRPREPVSHPARVDRRTKNLLGRVLPGYTNHRTFPSMCPLFHLDRVYLWPRAALVASHTDPEARKISDHLPVIGDIRL